MLTSFKEWQGQKAWTMSKDDLFKHWYNLPPSMPIMGVHPVPQHYKGSTYHYDGVRITGSMPFINSCMARLKDLLQYENPSTRLQAIYRQQIDNKTEMPIPKSFVFYVQVRSRESAPPIQPPAAT